MDKKNTKTDIEPKKTNQTADLEESEGTEITENPVKETENPVTEITEMTENIKNPDDSLKSRENSVDSTEITENSDDEIAMGMVYCKKCKKDVDPYSTEKGWRCPTCNKFVESPEMKKEGETLREVKPSKDRPYEITSSRNLRFSGNETAQAEMLIQSGVAKDFHDLAKKAFNLLFIKEKLNKAFGNQNTMELNQNREPNPERTMRQIQEQEMMKAYTENMKKGNQPNPMEMMMMLRQMENPDKGKSSDGNGFMNQLAMMQMMQAMTKPQGDYNLRGEIAELKHQMQMQQMMNQQAQTQQGNTSSQQFMQQMEQIRSERDKSIKAAEIEAQQERDKNLQLAFENRRVELESRLQGMEKELKDRGSGQVATQRIKQMKEEISAIKEMSHELGDTKKGAGEYISETVTNVASQLQPALTKFMEQKEQQKVMQQQMQQLPPEPIEQIQTEPLPSDMTESEQQMSEQMSDMYLQPPKKVNK